MYRPPAFREDERDTLLAMAREIGFASIVSPSCDGLQATHAPVIVRDDAIEFHVAKANPHWGAVDFEGDTVVMFQGPSAYVHPGWYPTKAATGRVVPTWLYTAVHVRGRLQQLRADELSRHLVELTDENEAGRERPWAVGDAPADYLEKMERAIVGLRVPVASVEGVRKLNQHKREDDFAGVREGLRRERPSVAALMDELG